MCKTSLGASGFGFRVSGFGCRVQGVGCRGEDVEEGGREGGRKAKVPLG